MIKYLTIIAISIFTVFNAQENNQKLGIIFKFNGPLIIHRDALENIPRAYENDNEEGKYYDAINAMNNENINPVNRIRNFYLQILKENHFEIVEIINSLSVENFPQFNNNKKYYPLNVQVLKKEYDVDKVLVIECNYGLEFENIGIVAGDKRANIRLSNFLITTSDNAIVKDFFVQNIKNVKKKDLLNPPIYPNIEESMNRLLNERIFPTLKIKLDALQN